MTETFSIPRTTRVFKGNEWEYGYHNASTHPVHYPSYHAAPEGVLEDYVKYLQEHVVQDGWESQGVLVSPGDALFLSGVLAVFTHPERDLLYPYTYGRSNRQYVEEELVKTFLREGVSYGMSKIKNITRPFEQTNYESVSSNAGFNLNRVMRPGKPRFLRRPAADKIEEYYQLGVGYVGTSLSPIEPEIESQRKYVEDLIKSKDQDIQELNEVLARLQRRINFILKKRAYYMNNTRDIDAAQKKLGALEAKLRENPRFIPGL